MKPFLLFVAALAMQAPPTPAAPMPEPKSTSVPRIDAQVNVDGVLDEQAWQKAARVTPFVHHDTMDAGSRRNGGAHLVRRDGVVSGLDVRRWRHSGHLYPARQQVLGGGGRRVLRHPHHARPLLRAAMESTGRHLRRHHHERARPRWPFEAVQRRLVLHCANHDVRRQGRRLGAELDRSRSGAGRSRHASPSPI